MIVFSNEIFGGSNHAKLAVFGVEKKIRKNKSHNANLKKGLNLRLLVFNSTIRKLPKKCFFLFYYQINKIQYCEANVCYF